MGGGGDLGVSAAFFLVGVEFSGRFFGGSVDLDDLLRLSGDSVLHEYPRHGPPLLLLFYGDCLV